MAPPPPKRRRSPPGSPRPATATPARKRELTGEHKRSFPNAKRKTSTNLAQISPETTPLMPSSPEKRRGNLTLAGDIEDTGGTEELLDLSLKLYKALPPRSRAPLSAPPPARTPEERGPADRRREKRVALEIALWHCRKGKDGLRRLAKK